MTTKFEIRIISRLLERLNKKGLDSALEYGIAVCGSNPPITGAVLAAAPEPLKTLLDSAFSVKRSKLQLAHEEMAARQATDNHFRSQAIQEFVASFESTRRIGQAAAFLAGLTMAERALCKATKHEVADAVAMRRNCIRSTKVKELLGCSDAELKRWTEDGRLPVMFRRRMPSSAGRALDVRHWDVSLIQEASQQLVQWREDDVQTKRRKRTSK